MVPELEKPRVTEIQVRMDCNGCVQKIKKALHDGIYDLYIDFPQQKITIIGLADPEKLVKAIKKTRKTAIICFHTEPPDPAAAQESESPIKADAQSPESTNPPSSESTNPPPTKPPPAEAAPPAEPPKDSPPPENPKSEAKPSPDAAEQASASHPVQPAGPKDVKEVHAIYHHSPDYGYRYSYNHNMGHGYGGEWPTYPGGLGFKPQPQTYPNACTIV